MTRVLLLLGLAGCALPGGDVVSKGDPAVGIVSCDPSDGSPAVGEACSLTEPCSYAVGCCAEKFQCAKGVVVSSDRSCDAARCPACEKDDTCQSGDWCIDLICQPCPEVTKCPDCPAGQVWLLRNGCKTCECG